MDNQQKVRENIIEIYKKKPNRAFTAIARELKVSRNTVSRVVRKYNDFRSVNRSLRTDIKKGISDPNKARQIVGLLKKNPNLSNRKTAVKANCSEFLVRKVKKSEGLKTYKVQKVPDRNSRKNEEAKERSKKLYRNFITKYECCIMDDETYVLGDFSQLPGQEFYVADARGNVEEKFRTQKKTKFPKKFLVWQAICSCGKRSTSYITTGTINTDLYIKECLEKRLLPFIREHDVSTFFWPDLASCHYSKSSLEWYDKNNVVLVPREANPPNCPELRPIERYWALVKKIMKNTKQVANDAKNFKNKWSTYSKKVTDETIKSLMAGITEKVKMFIKTQ